VSVVGFTAEARFKRDAHLLGSQTIMQTPQQQKEQTKPIYGIVSCSVPGNATVSERYGRKSIVAVNVSVPILAAGIILDASIWSRLTKTSNGDEQIVFEASFPRGIKAADEFSSDQFKDHVHRAVAAWNGYEAACATAESKLLGTAKPKGGVTALAPRLVKRTVTQPGAPVAA
jgi:hypothetical protein